MYGDFDLTTAYFCSTMASMQAASDRLTYVERYVFAKGQNLSAGKTEHFCKGILDRLLHGTFFKHISHSILDVGLARKQHHVGPIWRFRGKRLSKGFPRSCTSRATDQAWFYGDMPLFNNFPKTYIN